ELYVDNRLRRCRVLGLFAVGMGVPLVFAGMVAPEAPGTPLHTIAYVFVFGAWCGFVIPLLWHRALVVFR
ncbi:MAG TPA: hypothetical protein VMV65_09580, partial [Alphaproteobacteria bacterium]|nr:hypothetical protein [Alphaproteobacteria bacterium]